MKNPSADHIAHLVTFSVTNNEMHRTFHHTFDVARTDSGTSERLGKIWEAACSDTHRVFATDK